MQSNDIRSEGASCLATALKTNQVTNEYFLSFI